MTRAPKVRAKLTIRIRLASCDSPSKTLNTVVLSNMRRSLCTWVQGELRYKRPQFSGSLRRYGVNDAHCNLCVAQRGGDSARQPLAVRGHEAAGRNNEQLKYPETQLPQLIVPDAGSAVVQSAQHLHGGALAAAGQHDQIIRASVKSDEQWEGQSTFAWLRRQSAEVAQVVANEWCGAVSQYRHHNLSLFSGRYRLAIAHDFYHRAIAGDVVTAPGSALKGDVVGLKSSEDVQHRSGELLFEQCARVGGQQFRIGEYQPRVWLQGPAAFAAIVRQ